MGKARECPPPLAMNMEWSRIIRGRLIGDLISVLQSLPRSLSREKTIIEPELCMMGRLDGSSATVEMKPTVLIRCGSKRCQKAVANAVEDLEYLQSFSKSQVVIQRRAPQLASGERDTRSDYLAPNVLEHDVISVEVGITVIESACGLQIICRHLDAERSCTLGGLVRVDDRVYGLTTAHAMVSLGSPSSSETCSSYDSDPEDHASSRTASEISTDLAQPSARIEASEDVVRPGIQGWATSHLGPYSYATQRHPLRTNNAYPVSNASDFALIELPKELCNLPNAYTSRWCDQESMDTITGVRTPSVEDLEASVSILCSPTDVCRGYLLPGDHLFLDRATVFSTKKIQLNSTLREYHFAVWTMHIH